jgi:O-acetyl-ADP-ribose deacetylase (regulator of RNase III)
MNRTIELINGDITKVAADAIVNAANESLLGGGGVDGAIHNAAGPELLKECKTLGGCETGKAKITKGYNLPAKFVIHTVGPVWEDGKHNEAELLRDCYLNTLVLAEQNGIENIAFPSISTGVYGFPKEQAAEIAVRTVRQYIDSSKIEKIVFVAFDDETYEIYRRLLRSRNI